MSRSPVAALAPSVLARLARVARVARVAPMASLLALALALALGGCSKDPPPPPPSPVEAAPLAPAPGSLASPAAPAATADSPPAAAPAGMPLPAAVDGILPPGAADQILAPGARALIRLGDAGAEPRVRMRYSLEPGAKKTLGLGLELQLGLTAGGKPLPNPAVPFMRFSIDVLTTEKTAAGDAKVVARLGEARVVPHGPAEEQMATAVRAHLGAMSGLGLTGWLSPSGAMRDVKAEVPRGFPGQAEALLSGMNQSLESMFIPLPSDPVGLGARWQVITRLKSGGVDLLQFATYTLLARDGQKVALEGNLAQLAASSVVQAPADNMTVTLTSFEGSATGLYELRTDRAALESGHTALKSHMTLTVGAGGRPGEATRVDTTMGVTYDRPKGGDHDD